MPPSARPSQLASPRAVPRAVHRSALLALALAVAAASGCAPGRSVLTLEVTADPPLPAVASLELSVTDGSHSPARTAAASVTVDGGVPPMRSFSFVLPADVSGTVTVALTAHGSAGVLATASREVAVHPSEVATASFTLAAAAGAGVLGAACSAASSCQTPLDSCTAGVADVDFSDGYCTTVCNSGQAEANCTAAGGDCQDVGGLRLCLARCHPAQGMGCRSGYKCCDGGAETQSGWCAPATSNVCIPRG
jgi:hypothetical protein